MDPQNSQYKILKPNKLSNGYVAVRVHYSVHPLRDNPEWIKRATQGMRQIDIDREWDCKLTGGEGTIFPYECLYDNDTLPILRSQYEPPVKDKTYVIGADCSEGSGNPACAVVMDNFRNEVHQIHGRQEPRLFAKTLFSLGVQYNNAKLAVENEKYGAIVLTKLQDMHYPNLYYSTSKPRIRLGKREKGKRKLGWQPNRATKLQMITDLVEAMIEGTIGIATPQTIAEMSTFIEDDNGKMGASAGEFDDRVIATAIAYQLALSLPASLALIAKELLIGDSLETIESYRGLDIGAVSVPRYRERGDEDLLISHRMDW